MAHSLDDLINKVTDLIIQSSHLVIFTGAGISTASGVPDFRGPDGVWTRRDKGLKPKPLSKPWHEFEPNAGHFAVVELQNMKLMKYLISQNVDGFHIKSGINRENIAELHGNSTLMKCIDCDLRFTKPEINWDDKKYGRGYRTHQVVANQPVCTQCRGRIISSVVNFGDPMPEREMSIAYDHSELSDVFLALGSTLSVVPAATMPKIAKRNGASLVIINRGETAYDHIADVRIEGDVSEILPTIVDRVKLQIKS
ncbi:MAG: Sir2 family NAD-dependent protein deacetylase [Candidatus Kariarchaeaceae archaeon]|jgi:mono-ADP-ribosyltransferase sirtuin 6